MKRYCIWLSILLILQITISCENSGVNYYKKDISKLIENTVKRYDLPGLVVAVFSSDSILYTGAYGTRKLNTDDSLKVDNQFHIGSNTKAFISYAAASLIEDGMINWDTKFFDICPEMKTISIEDYYDITLFQLLTHNAGIVSKSVELKEILLPSTVTNIRIGREDLFKWTLNKDRYRDGFQYSNTGYVMAAYMLEKAANQDWKTLVTERVLIPLEIECCFGWPATVDSTQPWGHFLDPTTQNLVPHDPNDNYNLANISLDPAGDISMTILEYTKFIQDNLKGYTGRGGILRKESYKIIHTGDSYGLGWGIVDEIMGYKNVSTHSGSAGTFFCQALVFKEDDLGIIIFSNAYIKDTRDILNPLIEGILKITM
jgi:D-alanyl-D-alanine carboxypeptidase